MVHKERIERTRQLASDNGLSALALIPSANLFYLTGLRFGLSERSVMLLIGSKGQISMVVPELEYAKVRALPHVGEVFWYKDEQGPADAFARAVKAVGPFDKPIGFEYRSMRVQELELLKAASKGIVYTDASALFASMRMVKDDAEIGFMKKAAEIAEAAMDCAQRHIRAGITEFAVQHLIYDELRRSGVTGDIIMSIASGKRSGVAHNGTSDKIIEDGDFVWVDFMASYEGYYSDITRTFVVGQPSHRLQQIYQIVLEAQQAAREEAKPGMTGREIDKIARDIIESRGYGAEFTHRTGHGLGLEVHEEPYIVASNDVPLEKGMTFTIEPGIYLPDEGGVRIEDDVLLVEGGAVSLTNYRRNLLTSKSKYVV